MHTRRFAATLSAAALASGLLAVVPQTVTAQQGGAEAAAQPAQQQAGRDPYAWPFAWDSIWNLPLAKTAEYAPFDTQAEEIYIDHENISVNPNDPVRTLNQTDLGEEVPVHVNPELEADGSWNNCSTLLVDSPDKQTVVQGQPMVLEPGGDPSWDYSYGGRIDLKSKGIEGCHGGSGLSGLGGDIRGGELTGEAPIRHALKIGLSADLSFSPENGGFQWPAVKADSGYEDGYGGDDPRVHMGTLFALPPDFDLNSITEPDVRKVAEAMKTYGAYIVDSTGGGGTNQIDVQNGYQDELPNVDSAQMHDVFANLHIVTNSTEQTPGGGTMKTPRLAECAPAFTDGTGGAPPNCGAGG